MSGFDGTNRKNIRAAEKAAALEQTNRIAYTRQIMESQPGRAWMYSLLVRCAIFQEPFVPGRPDSTAYNLGRAGVGRPIFDDIFTYCPREYALMMQEAQAKETVDGRRYDADADVNRRSDQVNGRNNPAPGTDTYTIGPDGFVLELGQNIADLPDPGAGEENGDDAVL